MKKKASTKGRNRKATRDLSARKAGTVKGGLLPAVKLTAKTIAHKEL